MGNLNKAELKALEENTTAERQIEKLKAQKDAELKQQALEGLKGDKSFEDYIKKIKKLKKEKKDGVISFEELEKSLKKETKVMDAAKGGEVKKYAKGGSVKKYMGGGSVHKNKSKMITKRGWGASRKT
jgi:alcohol dehydrogenase class IV